MFLPPSFFRTPKYALHSFCHPKFPQGFVFKCSWEYAVLPGEFENNPLCKIWGTKRGYNVGFEKYNAEHNPEPQTRTDFASNVKRETEWDEVSCF